MARPNRLIQSGSSLPPAPSSSTTSTAVSSIFKSNDRARRKLALMGESDPTSVSEPTVMDRILGPLQARDQMILKGLDTLIGRGFQEPGGNLTEEDVYDLGRAGVSSLGGKPKVQGYDVLQSAENRFGFQMDDTAQGLAGMGLEVLIGLTAGTSGLTAASKSGAVSKVAKLAKSGIKAKDLASLGYSANRVARILAKYGDEAGVIKTFDSLPASLADDIASKVYINAGKAIGDKGGLKLFGVSMPGSGAAQDAMNKLVFQGKRALEWSPGGGKNRIAKTFEQMFHYDAGAGAVKNELQRMAYRGGKQGLSQSGASANLLAREADAALKDAVPDQRSRMVIGVGISKMFGSDHARAGINAAIENQAAIKRALNEAKLAKSAAIPQLEQDLADASAQVVKRVNAAYAKNGTQAITDTLASYGINDPAALDAAVKIGDDMSALLEQQIAKGVDARALFPGMGGKGYLPGMPSLERTGSDAAEYAKNLAEIAQREGFSLPAVSQAIKSAKWNKILGPGKMSSKTYDTVLARLKGVERGSVKPGDINLDTELDVAALVAQATERAHARIALKEFSDTVGGITADAGDRELLKTLEGFTAPEAVETVLEVWGKAANAWKKSVTVLRGPGFPIRNKISNIPLMMRDGMFSPERLAGDIEDYIKGQRLVMGKGDNALLRRAEQAGLFGKQGRDELLGVKKGRIVNKIASVNKKYAEDPDRMAVWLSGIRRGMSDTDAAALANRVLFDYGPESLTSFERGVMKRLVPFYIWKRRNYPAQFEALAKNPSFMTMVDKAKRNMVEAYGINPDIIPERTREAGYIPIGSKDKPVLLQLSGVLPMGDLSRAGLFDEAAGSLDPFLKDTFEMGANYDLFQKAPLEDPNMPGERRKSPEILQTLDLILGGAERPFIPGGVDIRTDTKGNEFMATNNRFLNKLVRDFAAPLQTVGKVITPRDSYGRIAALTGLRGMDYDVPEFEKQKAYEDAAALEALLIRLKGEGKVVPDLRKQTAAKKSNNPFAKRRKPTGDPIFATPASMVPRGPTLKTPFEPEAFDMAQLVADLQSDRQTSFQPYTPPQFVTPTPSPLPTPEEMVSQMAGARRSLNFAKKQAEANNLAASQAAEPDVKVTQHGTVGAFEPPPRGTTGLPSQRGTGKYGLNADFWRRLQNANRAMKAAGLGTFGITDGFRPLGRPSDGENSGTQWGAWKRYQAGHGAQAARPGTSRHGVGRAADLDLTPSQQRWLEANGHRFGIRRIASESWHWQPTN